MIEKTRWICSLPVTKITRYSGRIYRTVADMKARRKLKNSTEAPINELGQILIEASGNPALVDEIIRAEN